MTINNKLEISEKKKSIPRANSAGFPKTWLAKGVGPNPEELNEIGRDFKGCVRDMYNSIGSTEDY
jgi:hypothetical protein